jgi:MoaA/NifB/PqqE/SkfB family radical SAM enzyme
MNRWLGHAVFAFSTVVLRRRVPYLFGLVVTDRCNLSCFYCESKNTGRFHLDRAGAVRLLEEAHQRGHRALYLTGGEPMLWEDSGSSLADLVAEARRIGFGEVLVYTNGTRPLDIPGCSYAVAIEGPREVHDRIRGSTYELVLDNARRAVTPNVFASITFHRLNAELCEQIVAGLAALGIFRGISFNLLTHSPEVVAAHGVLGADRERLLDRLWRLRRQGLPITLSRAAYRALRTNRWRRPVPQIELGTRDRVFTCCRDVGSPSVCAICGYAGCVEVAQALALRPTAVWQMLRLAARA